MWLVCGSFWAKCVTPGIRRLGLSSSLLVTELADISLDERCRRVNEWCRQLGKDNVILISIHCNAVLTENLFMDNNADCDFLLSKEGQQTLVDLHVDGIISYLGV